MSKRRYIKTLLVVYVLCLLTTVLASLYLLQTGFSQFQKGIYENSQGNLQVIDTLHKIETSLYIYKNSVQRLLLTGDDKWQSFMKESEQNLSSYFDFLETYNDDRFTQWVRWESFMVDDPVGDLNKAINQYHENQGDGALFQKSFYLVRYNIQRYIQQKKDALSKRAEDQITSVEEDVEEDVVVTESPAEILQMKAIFAGVNQLLNQYHALFWDRARQQESLFERNTRLYYRAFFGVAIFLVCFSLFLFWQVLSYLSKRQDNQDSLLLLGARDGTTGLFNRRSFEILMSQELERAKRRGYHLSLLAVKVEPLAQIRQDLGKPSSDRLMFQIAEMLRSLCRFYDGLFKYDDDTFVLVHPEADPNAVNVVVKRFKKALYKKEFLVKSNQTSVIPKISVGIAVYPTDGVDCATLVQFAMGNLSVDFDLKPANDNPTLVEPVLTDEPVIETPPEPVAEPVVETVLADESAGVGFPHSKFVVEPVIETPPEPVAEPVVETVLADEPIGVGDEIPDVVAALFQKEGVEAKFADVQVVNAEGQDVIMVDFDREKDDLAQKFRRKIFDKRKRS